MIGKIRTIGLCQTSAHFQKKNLTVCVLDALAQINTKYSVTYRIPKKITVTNIPPFQPDLPGSARHG